MANEATDRTGEEFSQGGWTASTSHTCLSRQGSIRLHANRLIFYSGLACKSSRAKPHCNTRSHKASWFNIISKVQTHWESGSSITSIFISLDFPSFHPTSVGLPHFSPRLTSVRVLTVLMNPKCPDSTSGNPLCCYSFEEERSNNLGFCHSSHRRYRSLHVRKHLEIPQTSLWRGTE